jgi:hypothetical protein
LMDEAFNKLQHCNVMFISKLGTLGLN